MSETDAVFRLTGADDIGNDVSRSNVDASDTPSQIAMPHGDSSLPCDHFPPVDIIGDQLPGDGYLLFTHATLVDSSGSMDFALHQLTTATDLFDVPVIDFDAHSS